MNKELIADGVIKALMIRDEIHKIYKKHNVNLCPCKEMVNPFYNQTDETKPGYMCEYSWSELDTIYTPLGYLSIASGYLVCDENSRAATREIEEIFGIILIENPDNDSFVTEAVRKTANITKFPWEIIPIEVSGDIQRPHADFIPYDESINMYNEIYSVYQECLNNK